MNHQSFFPQIQASAGDYVEHDEMGAESQFELKSAKKIIFDNNNNNNPSLQSLDLHSFAVPQSPYLQN